MRTQQRKVKVLVCMNDLNDRKVSAPGVGMVFEIQVV